MAPADAATIAAQNLELLVFADQTTDKLWHFCEKLHSEGGEGSDYCDKLATDLMIINKWLAQQEPSALKNRVRSKIATVLTNLDRLCNWTRPSAEVGRPQASKKSPAAFTFPRAAGTRQAAHIQAGPGVRTLGRGQPSAAATRLVPLDPRKSHAGSANASRVPSRPSTPRSFLAPSSTPTPQSGRSSATGTQKESKGQMSPSKTYPQLALLLTCSKVPPAGLVDFARWGKENPKALLIQRLGNFIKDHKADKTIGVVRTGGDEDDDPKAAPADEQTTQLQTLYKLVKEDCICNNAEESRRQTIIANIHLKTSSPSDDPQAVFRIMFLDHPHKPPASEICQWQDTEIKFSEAKVISFADQVDQQPSVTARHLASTFRQMVSRGRLLANDAMQDVAQAAISHAVRAKTEADRDNDFCKLIRNRQRTKLLFEVSKGKILVSSIKNNPTAFWIDKDSVALRKLLNAKDFNPQQRLLLSYLLAEAVWRFYRSNWMKREWTKRDVHFMYEDTRVNRDSPGIFVDKPFLQADFGEAKGDDFGAFRSHAFPKILSLGVMLLEIELQLEIEDEISAADKPGGKPTASAAHKAAVALSRDTGRWGTERRDVEKKKIIDACLMPSDFEAYAGNVEGQRAQLWACVVEPLKKLYENSLGGRVEVDPVMLSDAAGAANGEPSSPGGITTNGLGSIPRLRCASLFDDNRGLNDATDRVTNPGVDYLNRLKEFRTECISPLGRRKIKDPIRVAILDSGIDLKKDRYLEHCSHKLVKRIFETKDWIGNDCHDNYGHGTYVARFFLEFAPLARLYVGKICEGKDIPSEGYKTIADAIDHATMVWNVDIISLSIGMDHDDEGIKEAIKRATRPKKGSPSPAKIVFAAACNGGPIGRRAFPARMPSVICVNASDGHGGNISLLSPGPAKGKDNFLTLGAYVRYPPHPYTPPPARKPPQDGDTQKDDQLQDSCCEYMSGTSFATPIAAAIAASILDFARFELNMSQREKEWLFSRPGISAVLKSLSTPMGEYSLLAPWLVPDELVSTVSMSEWVKSQVEDAIEAGT